ncbi:MAG: DUF6259 domain-containing protein [Verrucomicrobiia bacterium]
MKTTPTHPLENDQVRLVLDSRGRLLEWVSDGHNYAGGTPVWRLYLSHGQRFQLPISADQLEAAVTGNGRELRFYYSSVGAPLSLDGVGFEFRVWIEGDEVRWHASLHNDNPQIVVKELHFPLVGNCQLRGDEELITTAYGGLRHPSPAGFIREQFPLRHHWYCNEDHEGLQVQKVYPGCDAAENCFVMPGVDRGLYFGSHDPTFRNTAHLWRLEPGDRLEAGFSKHLYLRGGDALEIEGYVLSAYRGTWHQAANKYAAWARGWFRPEPRPSWMRGYRGWQRLILKHQNGRILFPYDSFTRIREAGAAAGIHSLFMFGWWPGGMDRMYPDYVPDPELGGEQSLRENIRRFQDNGGSVMFYASGRLVDRESEFYRQYGSALAIKTRTGAEARDTYLFGNTATIERLYGAVELVPMCLDCPQWQEVLRGIIDQAADYGCKGVFFDQLGLQELPCWDKTHGHPVPYVTQTQGKRRVISELRAHCKSRDPNMALGVEVFADAIGHYFDFIHGLYHQNYLAQNPDYQQRGEKPVCRGFIDFTRYIFPEVLISDRDIRDGNDVERRVNFVLTRGLIHDVEIHRCRETIDAVPHYQAWLGAINALRDRQPHLLEDTYRDTLGFECDNPEIEARCFTGPGRLTVVATQSHLESAAAVIRVPGARLQSWDGAGGFRVSRRDEHVAALELDRHAVATVNFSMP